MPLFEVCLKGDDLYSLRVLASNRIEAISKAMSIATNVSERNFPNYKVQVIQIQNDQPMCSEYDDAVIEP